MNEDTVCKLVPYLYTDFFTFYMKVVRLVLFFCVPVFLSETRCSTLRLNRGRAEQHFYHKEVKTAYLWSSPCVCVCDSWPAGALCNLFVNIGHCCLPMCAALLVPWVHSY